MRTYGRVNGVWVVVETDENGHDDYCWITTLIQCLQLTPGESPFFANYGIPSQQSIVSQVYPDFYVAKMQELFAQYFASLSVSRAPAPIDIQDTTPTYNVNVVTNRGVVVNTQIAV